METTRLSTKGQIVLPKSIRTSRAWKAGTEFTVEETREGILLKPAATATITSLEQLDEALRPIREKVARLRKKPLTLKEMDESIAAEVRRRHARGRY
jgi:AbrB family looped-hinge helix DNA binding protein